MQYIRSDNFVDDNIWISVEVMAGSVMVAELQAWGVERCFDPSFSDEPGWRKYEVETLRSDDGDVCDIPNGDFANRVLAAFENGDACIQMTVAELAAMTADRRMLAGDILLGTYWRQAPDFASATAMDREAAVLARKTGGAQ